MVEWVTFVLRLSPATAAVAFQLGSTHTSQVYTIHGKSGGNCVIVDGNGGKMVKQQWKKSKVIENVSAIKWTKWPTHKSLYRLFEIWALSPFDDAPITLRLHVACTDIQCSRKAAWVVRWLIMDGHSSARRLVWLYFATLFIGSPSTEMIS